MSETGRNAVAMTWLSLVAVGTVIGATLTTCPLSAQEPAVKAYLDPAEVEIGEPFRLIVEVSDVKEVEDVFISPVFQLYRHARNRALPFTTEITTPETEGAGGVVRFAYSFMAGAAGSVEIGPVVVTAHGHSMETEVLTLAVKDPPAVTVRARLEPAEVELMGDFTVIVEFSGVEALVERPVLPDVSDFARSGSRSSSPGTARFSFVASKPGTHQIDPVSIKVGNNIYETEPMTLVVNDGPGAVQAHASINSEQVWLGGNFVLVVEVDGVRELDEPPSLPDMSGFAEPLRGSSGGGGFGMSGGRYRTHHDYIFRAVAPGEFEIGPVRVVAAGQTMLTEPIRLTIGESPPEPPVSPEDLLVATTVDRSRAYVGEPVIVSYRVLSRSGGGGGGALIISPNEHFRIQELEPHWREWERTLVDGRWYATGVEHQAAFIPLEPGESTIDPGELRVQIHRRGHIAPFTEDGGRARWLGTWTPMILTTDPITIEVLPLPAEGRPESFGGQVGRVGLVAWVDRTDAVIGDTVTLSIELSGGGSGRLLPDPQVEFPAGFDVSGPASVSQTEGSFFGPRVGDGAPNGTRLYTYRLVANAEGVYQIPAIEIPYLDPESARYGIARAGPFDIAVASLAKE